MNRTSKASLWKFFYLQYCRSLPTGLYLCAPFVSTGKDATMFLVMEASDLSSDRKPPGCGAIRNMLIDILPEPETV
jgi:hypothetical protein